MFDYSPCEVCTHFTCHHYPAINESPFEFDCECDENMASVYTEEGCYKFEQDYNK